MLITALALRIGYDRALKIGKTAVAENTKPRGGSRNSMSLRGRSSINGYSHSSW